MNRSNFPDNGAWIDYYGGPDTIEHVSFSDVIQGKIAPGKLPRQDRDRGRHGGKSPGPAPDFHVRPDDAMAGPEIQAQAVGTALAGFDLKPSPPPRSTWP